MKLVSALLVACIGLTACSEPYSKNLPESLVTDTTEQLGCVLASISRNTSVEPHFRTYEFIFKSRDSVLSKLSMLYRADYGLLTLPKDDTFLTDFDQDGYAGIVYMRTVPVGNYYIDKAKFVGQAVQLEAAKNQGEPFDIQPGGCTYIGEMRVTPLVGKGLMGHTTLKSAKVDVVNSWSRDFALFKKIYPNLDPARVKIEILAPSSGRIGVSSPLPPAG